MVLKNGEGRWSASIRIDSSGASRNLGPLHGFYQDFSAHFGLRHENIYSDPFPK